MAAARKEVSAGDILESAENKDKEIASLKAQLAGARRELETAKRELAEWKERSNRMEESAAKYGAKLKTMEQEREMRDNQMRAVAVTLGSMQDILASSASLITGQDIRGGFATPPNPLEALMKHFGALRG